MQTTIPKCVFPFIYIFCISISVSHGYETGNKAKFNIPYELLLDDRREEVKEIITKHTIFRDLRDIEFKVDESVLIFMMEHPVFLSATLKAMKIRDYLIKYGNDGMYLFEDRKGISGKFEVIYSRLGKKYYYGFGGYYGLFLKLVGRGVLLFEYRGVRGNPPRTYVSANVYTKIDNVILEVLIKILKPIIRPLMDKKIYKFINETQSLAKEITMRPEKVYQTVKESESADKAELKEFKNLIF